MRATRVWNCWSQPSNRRSPWASDQWRLHGSLGRKSERPDPDQFELALEDIGTGIATIKAEEETCEVTPKPAVSSPRTANRGSLPKHLPRVEEVIEPDTQICVCGGGLHCIGEEVSERLDPPRANSPPDCLLILVDPGPVPGHRHPPSEVCLPVLFERCGASSGPGASDLGRYANRGDRGACVGLQIR